MTTTPAVLQVTFDGIRGEQLQRRWIAEVGGVEAYVFDGDDLATPRQWRLLRENLATAAELGAPAITMHFPTENADWVGDQGAFDTLLRFCDVAADHAVDGIVLHSNQFVSVREWPGHDLVTTRKRVVARLAELDERLAGASFWVGVENMPVIGSAGDDFDSVFVVPDDFQPLLELGSSRIGVTWDVCHWAVTYSTLSAIAVLDRRRPAVGPLAVPSAPIRHIHFSSFAGHAMPSWPGECTEGVTPASGDIDQHLLAGMFAAALDAAVDGTTVVFEVREDDYVRRTHCWETLAWVAAAEEPALRCVTRRQA